MIEMNNVFLVAMGYEIDNIFKPLGFAKNNKHTPYETWTKNDWVVVDMGLTKTNAAAATQWAIDNFDSEKWINIGLCGSIKNNFDFGEVVQVNECRFHDIDNRGLNPQWKIGQIPGDESPNIILSNQTTNLKKVKLISGDQFIDDKSKLAEIISEYDPDVVDEEATAVAKIMKNNGLLDRLLILKIISDNADSQASNDFGREDRLFGRITEIVKKMLI